MVFATQLTPDICRKIQKMDGFSEKNRSELLEIAQKVIDSRDSKEDLIQKMRHTIIVALQAPATLNSVHANHDFKKQRPKGPICPLQSRGSLAR